MIYAAEDLDDDDVSIGPPPDDQAILTAAAGSDVEANFRRWLRDAHAQEDVCYFAVYREERLIGQIFLHDWDRAARKALIGYHLLPEERNKGAGTGALGLLMQFVAASTDIETLIVITEKGTASERIAQKCGFVYAGPPWEDPAGVSYRWRVRRPVDA
jgi:RimJ/RimL family protein N-acetyltransferase